MIGNKKNAFHCNELDFNDRKLVFSWLSMSSTYTNTFQTIENNENEVFRFILVQYLKKIKDIVNQVLLLNSIINDINIFEVKKQQNNVNVLFSLEPKKSILREKKQKINSIKYGKLIKSLYNPKNDSYQLFLQVDDEIYSSNANPINYLNNILPKSYFRCNDEIKYFEIVNMDANVYIISIYYENEFIVSKNHKIGITDFISL